MNPADFAKTLRALKRSHGKPAHGGVGHLTPAQVAARWNGAIAVGTLANWRTEHSTRRGPAFEKMAGRVVYPIAAVEAYESKLLASMERAQ